jgi:hypothetical protein
MTFDSGLAFKLLALLTTGISGAYGIWGKGHFRSLAPRKKKSLTLVVIGTLVSVGGEVASAIKSAREDANKKAAAATALKDVKFGATVYIPLINSAGEEYGDRLESKLDKIFRRWAKHYERPLTPGELSFGMSEINRRDWDNATFHDMAELMPTRSDQIAWEAWSGLHLEVDVYRKPNNPRAVASWPVSFRSPILHFKLNPGQASSMHTLGYQKSEKVARINAYGMPIDMEEDFSSNLQITSVSDLQGTQLILRFGISPGTYSGDFSKVLEQTEIGEFQMQSPMGEHLELSLKRVPYPPNFWPIYYCNVRKNLAQGDRTLCTPD